MNNEVYEGTFLNNEKHGHNCRLKILAPFPYEINGTFKHNILQYGETILPDGGRYKGEFYNLLPEGKG